MNVSERKIHGCLDAKHVWSRRTWKFSTTIIVGSCSPLLVILDTVVNALDKVKCYEPTRDSEVKVH